MELETVSREYFDRVEAALFEYVEKYGATDTVRRLYEAPASGSTSDQERRSASVIDPPTGLVQNPPGPRIKG